MANPSSPASSLPNTGPPHLAASAPPPSSLTPPQSPPNATPSNSSNPSSSPPSLSAPLPSGESPKASVSAPSPVPSSTPPPPPVSPPPASVPPPLIPSPPPDAESSPPPTPSPPPTVASPPRSTPPSPTPSHPRSHLPPPTPSPSLPVTSHPHSPPPPPTPSPSPPITSHPHSPPPPPTPSPSPHPHSSPPPPSPQAVSPPPVISRPPPVFYPPSPTNPQPPPPANPPESPSPSGSNQASPPYHNVNPIVSPSPSKDEPPVPASPSSSNPYTSGTTFTPPSNSSLSPANTSTLISPMPTGPENEISSRSGGTKIGTFVGVGFVVCFLLLSLIGMAVWYVRKKKKKVSGSGGGYVIPTPIRSSQMSDFSYSKSSSSAPLMGNCSHRSGFVHSPPEPSGLGNSRSWFTYDELLQVTDGFSEQNLLGEGGFGRVYKGCLPDGREVAVKQLKVGGGQGEREFKAEVEIISRVHHRHLVSLVGYCISENQRLLVYDYVPNNTLYDHLHGHGRPVMDWATRAKVAAGAARGIAYLHEDCHPRIIHRDIKSSNILIDNNFEAQVSDFGLAKLALDSFTHVTTRVIGTFGYLAPEYASSGKLTEKSDVFSFGVVLLELITGRKPVDASQPLEDESLVEWARPLMVHALDAQDFEDLVDPRLEKNYDESEIFRMIEAAAACVRHSAAKRPRMSQVVRALNCIADSDLTNGVKPGQSELFNSAQQSAEIRLFERQAFGSQGYSIDFTQSELFSSAQQSAEIRLFERQAFGSRDSSMDFTQTSQSADREV